MGELLVGQRRPGAQFSGAETRLLRSLAGQAALAAEACRSTLELQRAASSWSSPGRRSAGGCAGTCTTVWRQHWWGPSC